MSVTDKWTRQGREFERSLGSLINRFSKESESNTPDFLLAEYLVGCLTAFGHAVKQRESWYGRKNLEQRQFPPVKNPIHQNAIPHSLCVYLSKASGGWACVCKRLDEYEKWKRATFKKHRKKNGQKK